MRGAAVAALAAALLVAACGQKNRPTAPELVRPETPEELTATATAAGVKLGWLRPLHYSGGQRMNDLDRFLIERAGGDGRFGKAGTFQLEDQNRFRKERHLEWVDHDVRPGETYLYRITAVTLDGY